MPHFRQIFDPALASFTYLLGDAEAHEAIVIDPASERATMAVLAMLDESDLRLACTLLTHAHDDEACRAAALKERTGAALVASAACPGVADLTVDHGDTITFGNEVIHVIATPGHTPGCLSYLWRDRVFTGDALLIGSCGRTDQPGGDPGTLYDSVTRRLFTLPAETLVFPAHDRRGRTVSTIAEERARGAAIAGGSRDEFITRRIAS